MLLSDYLNNDAKIKETYYFLINEIEKETGEFITRAYVKGKLFDLAIEIVMDGEIDFNDYKASDLHPNLSRCQLYNIILYVAMETDNLLEIINGETYYEWA